MQAIAGIVVISLLSLALKLVVLGISGLLGKTDILDKGGLSHPKIAGNNKIWSDMTKEQRLVDLTFRTKVLFWSGVVPSSLAVGVLSYVAVRWKEWRQVRRIQQDNSAASNERDAQVVADEETGDIADGELCGQHSFHVDTGR
ncbi:hypothetical protein DCAR_0311698 [Daucus carota subsp. sativus]|uniref:Uncharacterized protein n=1 Tax=Daucus carota subsp. sativus TaxID=79200 RepID=A0A175YAS8_DAUCS|nr:hypothetical protein DCAR_0311698 [Daucus carota subsp. sativus]